MPNNDHTYREDDSIFPENEPLVPADQEERSKNIQKYWNLGARETFSFVCALLSELASGTPYAFSAIGPQLSQRFSYTSTQTGAVAIIGDLGLYLSGPVLGIMVDKYGPNVVTFLSGVLCFTGYLFMSLTYLGHLHSTHFLLYSFYFFLVGFGSSGSYVSALSTVVKTVPAQRRGIAVGICVSFFGLSAFLFSRIRQAWLSAGDGKTQPDMTGWYLMLLALVLGSVNLVSTFGLYDPTRNQRAQPKNSEKERDGDSVHVYTPEKDIRGWEFFKSPSAWILFVNFILLSGSGLMMINNVGQVITAIYGKGPDASTVQNLHVSLLSLANCGGRIFHGITSDWAAARFGFPRLGMLVVAAGWQIVGHAMAYLGDGHTLPWSSTLLIGFGYGGVFSVTPSLVGDWFGLPSFATNWGWMTWGPAIGVQVSTLIFGRVFDSHATSPGVCRGPECYRPAFAGTFFACCTSAVFVTCVLLVQRRGKRVNQIRRD